MGFGRSQMESRGVPSCWVPSGPVGAGRDDKGRE